MARTEAWEFLTFVDVCWQRPNAPARFLFPQSRVPNLDLTVPRVAAARGQAPAVGAESQAQDEAGLATQRHRLGGRGRLQVPYFDGRVPTARGQVAAVGAEDNLPDIIPMALQRREFCARLCVPVNVPNLDGMIARRLVGEG